jgi:ATP-dependent RNA helicase DeaD
VADIAAALAVLTHDDRPLLMQPEPEPVPARVFDSPRGAGRGPWDHDKGRRRDRDEGRRPARAQPASRRSRPQVPLTTYRISVGKRHKVEPRQIVGAIANEGGLDRSDFGHIDIRGDHSLVELPVALSEQTLTALQRTRISGRLIDLTLDSAAALASPGAGAVPVTERKPRSRSRD